MRRLRGAVAPLVGVVVFFGLWELLLRAFGVKAFVMPTPTHVIGKLADDPGFFWREGLVTVREALTGLVLAFVAALLVAVPIARSRWLERAVQPIALLITVIPLVCYAPAFVIWMGPGFRPIAGIAAVVSFVPLMYNLTTGLRAADDDMVDLLRSAGASRLEVLRHVEIPSALPDLFAGLRIGVGLSLIGAVIGEWFALVSHGLGLWIRKAQGSSAGASLVWACAFALGLIGSVSLLALGIAERLLVPGEGRGRRAGSRPPASLT